MPVMILPNGDHVECEGSSDRWVIKEKEITMPTRNGDWLDLWRNKTIKLNGLDEMTFSFHPVERAEPKKIIFNPPATIVIWKDNVKTVVKCGEDEAYDAEKGVAMCYMKRFTTGHEYHDILTQAKEWTEVAEDIVLPRLKDILMKFYGLETDDDC